MCNIQRTFTLIHPRYDEDTFFGRARNFLSYHNPLNLFASERQLEEARCLYLKHRCDEPFPEDVTPEELWKAKSLYESAYQPETCKRLNTYARPCCQIPVNMLLAGGMMAYYKSIPGIIIWHWLNQTYNTFVSYENRGSDLEFTDQQLGTSYLLSTATAVGTALGLNKLWMCTRLPRRFGPMAAVAAAHVVSVPFMKAQELKNGSPIYDHYNCKVGYSKQAAQAGVSGSIAHKVLNAVPPLMVTPLIANYMEGRGTFCRYPWINFPLHAAVAGLCLLLLSPLACALLETRGFVPLNHLEPELKEHLCKRFGERPPKYFYYDRTT